MSPQNTKIRVLPASMHIHNFAIRKTKKAIYMKVKTILIVSAAALFSLACNNDKETLSVISIAGNYHGYTLANCDYFKNTYNAHETITIVENTNGTAKVTFNSNSWGQFTIPNAQIDENAGIYTLTGKGQTLMGMNGENSSYECDYTAVINSKDNAQMQFKVPAVMGGLTVTFLPGSIQENNK